jgi:hypothetical protein
LEARKAVQAAGLTWNIILLVSSRNIFFNNNNNNNKIIKDILELFNISRKEKKIKEKKEKEKRSFRIK